MHRLLIFVLSTVLYCSSYAIDTDSLTHLLLSPDCSMQIVHQIEKVAENVSDSCFRHKQHELLRQINKLEKAEDEMSIAKYYYFLGYRAFVSADEVEALKYFLTSLQFIRNNEYPYLQYQINFNIGDSYARIRHLTSSDDLYDKIIMYYLEAARLIESTQNNEEELISIYTSLGHFYHGYNEVEKSEDYYHKAVKYAEQIQCDRSIVKGLINLGNFYFKHDQIERGEKISLKALAYADSINYKIAEIYASINLCQIYTFRDDFGKAIYYGIKTFNEASSINNSLMKFRAKQELGRVYKKMGDTKNAIKSFESCLKYLDPQKEQKYINPVLKDLSSIYFDEGNFIKSSYYQKKYIQFSDSMNRADFIKRIQLAEALNKHESVSFHNKLLDNENKLRKAELSKSKSIAVLAMVIAILFIIIVLFQIKANRKYRKQNEFIIRQNKVISNQNQAIKQQNVDLYDYQNKLEQLVSERTTELKKALIQAENSNKFKSEFLKNITHEIRTPLNAIVGFSHLIENQDVEQHKKSLSIIKQNSFELMHTVEKVIEVSNIEKLCKDIELKTIKSSVLNNYISLELSKFVDKAHKAKLPPSYQLDGGDYEVCTDVHKLLRILTHILDNALKFDRNGNVSIFSKKNSKTLDFVIKDCGIGINKDDLDLIFESFQKIGFTNELYRGLGVGLTISSKLTHALNGDICIESEPDKGTKVFVSIPLS